MIYVIRRTETGEFLKSFDPDAHAPGVPYPTGFAEWTFNVNDALTFGHAGHAINFYKTQSKATPYRPDGRPNRPLTVFTVDFITLKDALSGDNDNAPRNP